MRRRYINIGRDEGMTCNCQMYCTDGTYQNRNIRCSRATSCDDCCSRAVHAFGCGRIAEPQRDTFMNAQGQDDCDPPQVMVNGVCVDEGLGGDPSREQGCPEGQYRDRFGKCRSMQPGTYNAKTKRPPINPFAPTTLPYDPMGAKQIGGYDGGCPDYMCMNEQRECIPCGSTGPTYPGAKQVASADCNPPCDPGCYCDNGNCLCGDPARQNMIARCDSYSPNCPGPRGSANYRSKTGKCCGTARPRATSTRRRR